MLQQFPVEKNGIGYQVVFHGKECPFIARNADIVGSDKHDAQLKINNNLDF
jgi:hypothetical protein